MNIFTEILILFSISYFIGSIPFGLILTNLWGYGDIRKIGSGNIGATNALRTGNKILALLVLLLDAFKSLFLIILFKYFELTNDNATYLFILLSGSIIGHCFPIWLKFKGRQRHCHYARWVNWNKFFHRFFSLFNLGNNCFYN